MSTMYNTKQCKEVHGDKNGGGGFDGRCGSEGFGGSVVLEVLVDDVLVVVVLLVVMVVTLVVVVVMVLRLVMVVQGRGSAL